MNKNKINKFKKIKNKKYLRRKMGNKKLIQNQLTLI